MDYHHISTPCRIYPKNKPYLQYLHYYVVLQYTSKSDNIISCSTSAPCNSTAIVIHPLLQLLQLKLQNYHRSDINCTSRIKQPCNGSYWGTWIHYINMYLTPELVYIVKFISKIYYFYWITKCITKYRHINATSYICKKWFQYHGFHRVPLRYYYRIFYSTVNVYGNVRLIVF